MAEAPLSCESVFVARQPIFTPEETIWGYELLFRTGQDNVAVIADESQATSSVIADGMAMAMEGMPVEARFLINFPERMLLDGVGFALPRERCVVEILENVRPGKEVLAAVRKLKDAGYTIAVDDYLGQPELLPFLELADILKIDVLGLGANPERIARALETIKGLDLGGLRLLAEKVEDNETFHRLTAMDFTLFQGFFFSRPEIIPGKKLTTFETTRLQLVSELAAPEFDSRRLGEILQSDPNLSYRLFRYINSVGMGLSQKVTSLKRAIDMMGMIQAKQWLGAVILADLNPSPRAGELAVMAVQRARFMELLCAQSVGKACQPDALFISGLFSLLDAMLGVRMGEILSRLPLDESIIRGLTGEGNIHDLLSLAHSYERGHWADTLRRVQRLGFNPSQVDRMYANSRNWAQRMLGYSAVKVV
jgi:EAL and modified HD-GYP domain-containing signal transduction protein